ncbi:MAG: FISUMP domain-containing protein, partial [Bacteroidota bacterium]
TNNTQTTATGGGEVTSDGGAIVTARGVCWSISPNPTTADSHTSDGSGTGTFVSNLTGLTPNTPYYVRAFATNSGGTAYGNEVQFSTLPNATLAVVTTSAATNITETTATSGGNVSSDGGATVTARGVCWNTTPNPTLANSHTSDGAGTGVFVSNLTGLTANTPYFVRAYATNSVGTAYGNEQTFATLPDSPCGQPITDTRDGKTYNTVLIGTQCWFAQNLNVGTKVLGSANQTNNSIIEKYCYNDLESNCDVYGGLYQWDEAMQYSTTEGVIGICPTGWHLPTDAEWTTLTTFLGGEAVAGGKMKETGLTHWAAPNTGATNSSGFTALPGGDRNGYYGNFENLTNYAFFWSSSQTDATGAWDRYLSDFSVTVGRDDTLKINSFSGRCIKD